MECLLEVHCGFTAPGDEVGVVGGAPELGNWDPQKSVRLKTAADLFPRWTAQLRTLPPAGTEFKVVVLKTNAPPNWENGSNRSWPSSGKAGQIKICLHFGEPSMQIDETPPINGYAGEKPSTSNLASPGEKPSPQPASDPQDAEAAPGGRHRPAALAADSSPTSKSQASDKSPQAPSTSPPSTTHSHRLREKLIESDSFGVRFQDRFEMLDNLGEGAFGVVCKAEDKSTKAIRAVKKIEKAHCDHMDDLKKEVDLSLTMDHPNIVRLFGMYDDTTHIYLVMELCEGGELFDRIVEVSGAGLKESTVQIAMQQMLRALAYCHSRDIVHRDLKPENFILQTKEPLDKAPLKLIDFGLAKPCPDGETLKSAVGTVLYVAPEIISRNYDKKVDIWSLGVIMYCLLCGAPPFGGATDSQILAAIRRGKYSIDGEKWDPVSEEVKDLLGRMLEKHPGVRVTAKGALEDVWFKRDREALGQINLHGSLAENLKSFTAENRFKRAALIALAFNLNEEEQKDIREIFTRFDVDGDGFLTSEELLRGYDEVPELQKMLPKANLEAFAAHVDADLGGRLEFTEFAAAFMDKALQGEQELYRRAFASFDTNNNGAIGIEELRKILGDDDDVPKSSASLKRVSACFAQADLDGDGQISLDEFIAMLKSGPKASTTSFIHKRTSFLSVCLTQIDEIDEDEESETEINAEDEITAQRRKFENFLKSAAPQIVKLAACRLFEVLLPVQRTQILQAIERKGEAGKEVQNSDFAKVVARADPEAVKRAVLQLADQLTPADYSSIRQPLEEASAHLLASPANAS
eukprot:TRINITY_DN91205_c0_g1_i1.p1 TRINITY_DN91205_c0_g1~~TRINITY_DN91205_c0_g1_i1.p1  ORF type:complete len:805 (-),score=165.01 TRINITY_DN91205_c0_g1_i1:46-2460(-)